jgi:hypothetical protein
MARSPLGVADSMSGGNESLPAAPVLDWLLRRCTVVNIRSQSYLLKAKRHGWAAFPCLKNRQLVTHADTQLAVDDRSTTPKSVSTQLSAPVESRPM